MGKYLIPLLFLSLNLYAKDIKVMVIDTGIDGNHIQLLKYVQAGSYDDLNDDFGHGTHVAGIIAESGCGNLKIISCKFFFKGHGIMARLYDCLDRAVNEHVDIINFSAGGPDPSQEEYNFFKKANDAGIKIIVAAGNDSRKFQTPCGEYFPACYKLPNMVIVGGLNEDGGLYKRSNYGMDGMKWEAAVNILSTYPNNKYARITGTSQATAAYTKHLVEDMCYK